MEDSIGSGLRIAREMKLPRADMLAVHDAASSAFVSGMQLAVVVAAVIVAMAGVVAWRYLPAREAAPQSAPPSPGDSSLDGLIEAEGVTLAAGD